MRPCADGGFLDGEDRVCDLAEGHTGPHVDLYDGWEW